MKRDCDRDPKRDLPNHIGIRAFPAPGGQQEPEYDDHVTERRRLGAGPQGPAHVRAAQAEFLEDLPGIRLPDLDDLRQRGVLQARPTPPSPTSDTRAPLVRGIAPARPPGVD